jgi:hypothetical protein
LPRRFLLVVGYRHPLKLPQAGPAGHYIRGVHHAAPADLSSADDIRLSPTALVVEDESMDQDRWAAILRKVGPVSNTAWYIGDLLAFGERQYGDGTYKLAAKTTGYQYGYLRNLASLSRQVPPTVRQSIVSHRAHRVVAKLDAAAQRDWLAQAAKNRWTAADLERAIGEAKFETNQNDDLDSAAHWAAAGMPDYEQSRLPSLLVAVRAGVLGNLHGLVATEGHGWRS